MDVYDVGIMALRYHTLHRLTCRGLLLVEFLETLAALAPWIQPLPLGAGSTEGRAEDVPWLGCSFRICERPFRGKVVRVSGFRLQRLPLTVLKTSSHSHPSRPARQQSCMGLLRYYAFFMERLIDTVRQKACPYPPEQSLAWRLQAFKLQCLLRP